MRIATLGNASVIHTQRWVEHFRARGHEVRLWSLEPAPSALGSHALPSAPLPGVLRYPLAALAARDAIRAFAPDVVDAHFVPNYGVIGRMVGWRPLVVTAWGSDLLVTGRANALQRARTRWVLEAADAVIADAENLAEAARSLGGGSRVHAIPWGVDLARFRSLAAREPELLLSTRMHEPVYDLDVVLSAARVVLESRPGARLVVAGEGSLTPRLRARAERELPADRVAFVGRLTPDAMAEWLGRAAVAISASRSDSTSMSLLESMAAGAVPVVSDLEGNREWVADGDGARLFAPGDPAGLARAVLDVLSDPAQADRMRARNRAEVERRADHVTNMARIERVFESVRHTSHRRGLREGGTARVG